jgi:hypothetical protein
MDFIHRTAIVLGSIAFALSASPAIAGWKIIPSGQIADIGGMTVTRQSDWNQSSAQPGKQGRAWTRDGFGLNGLELFAAVPNGQPLYRERNKKRNPMPKFQSSLLMPELADFFERSFRARGQISNFSLLESAPAQFGGHRGLRISYRYTLPNDELVRQGEARLVVVNRRLYVANFYAPEVHYFAAGAQEASAIMDGARF